MARADHTSSDLHFGLLATQVGLIDTDQLVAAFRDRDRDGGRSLAEALVRRGAITRDDRSLLTTMADRHLTEHGGDLEASLATMTVEPATLEKIAQLDDPTLTRTLIHLRELTPPREASSSITTGTATAGGRRFRVLRPHARGGLGAVFVALDAELNREVALKQILDHHADDPSTRRRFVAEAEITGGLEHPGIVPVYGLGHHDDGRPYYAMRFIRGDSLKEAIRSFHEDPSLASDPGPRSLALRKLLRRFVDVCNAVDYAHGRGVVHRDLKPANVIVGKHGETLVVDWGLAKAMGHGGSPGDHDGERALMTSSASGSNETLPGQAIGTPAFMSPEQAAGDLERLGPRSDVYSLGATLYCLLTGRLPFEGGSLPELLGRVRDGEFRPPRRLDPSVDRALEAVCLKAMARRPEDRHPTARALAEDVERWSADEPVSAWREPFSRRARRWARRNRPLVTAALAAVLMALAGLAAVLAVQRMANAALEAKNGDLGRANGRVQARFELAREAIRSLEAGVTEEGLLKERRFKPLRDKLLNSARRFYEKLEALLQEQADDDSRAMLAESYLDLAGLIDQIGARPEALAACTKAVEIRRDLASATRDGPAARLELARALLKRGNLLAATGDQAGAGAALREARTLATPSTGDARPSPESRRVVAAARHEEALVLLNTGRLEEALTSFRENLGLREALAAGKPAEPGLRSDLALSQTSLGILLAKLGRVEEADFAYREALRIRQGLARDVPGDPRYRADLAEAHHNIGWQLDRAGRTAEALDAFREARAIREVLARQNPALTQARRDLAHSLNNVGNTLMRLGRAEEALAAHRETLELREMLARDDPSVFEFRADLAQTLNNYASVLHGLSRIEEAMPAYRRALDLKRDLAREQPANLDVRRELAGFLFNIANIDQELGRREQALALHGEALAISAALAREQPSVPDYRMEQAESLNKVAGLLALSGRPEEAGAAYLEALVVLRRLSVEDPTNAGVSRELARSLTLLGVRRSRDGRPAEGLDFQEQALSVYRGLTKASPKHSSIATEAASAKLHAGDALRDLGRPGEARDHYQATLDALRVLAASDPTRPQYRTRQSGARRRLALLCLATGDRDGAALEAQEAVAIRERDRPRNASERFERACDRATLAAVGGGDLASDADRAIDDLRDAVAGGYRDLDAFRHEPALAPLRGRDDFRELMRDVAFPDDPFAH